jgi:uncharacterized protein YggL (DUF469 family)
MKTKTQVLKEYPDKKTLINAVINRVGIDAVNDINNYGIDGGFGGFIYYSETHPFAMRHRKAIVSWLEETACSLGEDVVSMVSHFGVFRNCPMDDADKKELYRYLSGARCEQSTITNVMAWFAAEEVCRLFED